jgi:hypothetical protein
MSETILSPTVVQRENDNTLIRRGPISFGAAILGPTAKGPVEIPTYITSYSEFVNKFGNAVMVGGSPKSYMTSIAVQQFFQSGGTSVLVARVTPGEFTPATSEEILSGEIDGVGSEVNTFVLETLSEGAIMNSNVEGTKDNLKFDITNVNESSGTFSLQIRRGDDTPNNKVILESFSSLSLDPLSNDYIVKRIGDMKSQLITSSDIPYIEEVGNYENTSNYVRVKSVGLKTPNYLNNDGSPKTIFSGYMPTILEGGTFENGNGDNVTSTSRFYHEINSSNTEGLAPEDYDDMISLLNNRDDYQFRYLVAPGLVSEFHTSQVSSLSNLAQFRGDCMFITDMVGYGKTETEVKQQAGAFDTSYTTTQWPWLTTIDSNTGDIVKVTSSTMMLALYTASDLVGEPWFAPAGTTRGLLNAIRAERKLPKSSRDNLYSSNINPISTLPGVGLALMGQKTLQKRATATDRVNVRRLLIELKQFIGQVANGILFDQNTQATRNSFLAQVNPYLQSVKERQGLFAFDVIMDDSNNTSSVIDRNQLVGQVRLQPTRTAEFIILDYTLEPTGTSFE